jgi:HTH-type transcriptional regulator, sugar sensing transcriptional regulator
MDTKILEDLGLTKSEIKVYLALLELGSSSAGDILKKARIQNSVLHFTLNNLIEKGLVTYVKRGKARVYQSADPETLISYVEDKKNQLKTILPELKKRQSLAQEKEEVEIFEGVRGVKTAIYTLIENTKPKDKFMFFSADVEERNEEIQKFYERFDAKRKDKKLNVMGIAPTKLKRLFKKREYSKMKYVTFPIPENTGICNDKLIIISWSNKPRAILIKSKSIVHKQRKFFEQIWKMGTS